MFVVGLAIIMVAAVVVCVPLLREQPRDVTDVEATDRAFRWEKQKRDAFTAIKEAELDHQMGKLSPADYAAIRAAQEERALEAMKALEGADARPGDRRGASHAESGATGRLRRARRAADR